MRKNIFSILLAAILLAPLPALAQLPTTPLHATRYQKFANAAGYVGNSDTGWMGDGSHIHQFHTLSYSRRLFNDYLAVSAGWFYEKSSFEGNNLFAEQIKTYQDYENNGYSLGVSYALYDQYYSTSDLDRRRRLVRGGLGVALFIKGYITRGYLTFDRNIKGYATYDLEGMAAVGGVSADYAFIKELAIEGLLSAAIGQVDLIPRIKREIEGQYQNAYYAITPVVNVAYYPIDQIKLIAGFTFPAIGGGDTMAIDRPSTIDRDMIRFFFGVTGFFEALTSGYGQQEYEEPARPEADDFEDEVDETTAPAPPTEDENDWDEAPGSVDPSTEGVAVPETGDAADDFPEAGE